MKVTVEIECVNEEQEALLAMALEAFMAAFRIAPNLEARLRRTDWTRTRFSVVREGDAEKED